MQLFDDLQFHFTSMLGTCTAEVVLSAFSNEPGFVARRRIALESGNASETLLQLIPCELRSLFSDTGQCIGYQPLSFPPIVLVGFEFVEIDRTERNRKSECRHKKPLLKKQVFGAPWVKVPKGG